jgi:hypothetical protein
MDTPKEYAGQLTFEFGLGPMILTALSQKKFSVSAI